MKTSEKFGYRRIRERGLNYFKVAPGVWGMKVVFVNIYLICEEVEGENRWMLIDAGLRGCGEKIRKLAEHLFGEGARPDAILLTHGHFDHVGALEELLEVWDVPVYAHYLELPYLRGISSYPPPDPMVGGGGMSLLSWLYPRKPKDLGRKVHRLSTTGELPVFKEWKFIHVPGHSPGQVAFYREGDKVLIAADAFVTTRQESVFSVITQREKLSGPPKYFTLDWASAQQSVRHLADLKPEVAATGHGHPMYGAEMRTALHQLIVNFKEEAVPRYGRYVKEPARANKNGVQYIPKKQNNPFVLTGIAVFGVAMIVSVFWKYRALSRL